MRRTGLSQRRDVFFMRLLEGLPAALKNALVGAGLADPCTLEDYPRMTTEEIHKRGVALQQFTMQEHATGTMDTDGIAATSSSTGGNNDNDNDTIREVPHPSNEGLALQARV